VKKLALVGVLLLALGTAPAHAEYRATDSGWVYCDESGKCIPLEEYEKKFETPREYIFPNQKIGFSLSIPSLDSFGFIKDIDNILSTVQNFQEITRLFNQTWASISQKFPALQQIPVGQVLGSVSTVSSAVGTGGGTVEDILGKVKQFYAGTVLIYAAKLSELYNTYANLKAYAENCKRILSHPEASKDYYRKVQACRKILSGDAWQTLYEEARQIFGGTTSEARKKLEKTQERIKQVASSVANQPFEKLNGKQVRAQIEAQEDIAEKALATPNDPPLDPEILKRKIESLPSRELQQRYMAVVNTALSREMYSKMVIEKEVAYSQQILALKEAVDKFCNADFSTPVPNCSSLSSLSGAIGIDYSPQFEDYPVFEQVKVGKGWVKHFVKNYVNKVAMSIISQIVQVGNMIATVQTQVGQAEVNSIAQAACTINQRIATEMNATRAMEKAMFCLSMKLQLAQLQLLLDNFHASSTTARGIMKQLTSGETRQVEEKYETLKEMGYEVPRK